MTTPLDFSDILGQPPPKPESTPKPKQVSPLQGVDFSDLLGPNPQSPLLAQPAEATGVTLPAPPLRTPPSVASGQYAPPYGKQPVVEPAESPAGVEGKEFLGTIKTLAEHPIATVMSAITLPFQQAHDLLTTPWDPNIGMARMERALARSSGTLTPELEAHYNALETQEEARRGLMAFQVSMLAGGAAGAIGGHVPGAMVGGAAYSLANAAEDEPKVGKAAAFALAALPLGLLAHLNDKVLTAQESARNVEQVRKVAPLEVNDEPPSSSLANEATREAELSAEAARISRATGGTPEIRPHKDLSDLELKARMESSGQHLDNLEKLYPTDPGLPEHPAVRAASHEFADLDYEYVLRVRERVAQAQPSPTFLNAQAAGKKLRDLESSGLNIRSAMMKAARDLGPDEQVIIPGIDNETFMRGLQSWPSEVDYVTHTRPDGTMDVAMYGKESVLNDPKLRAGFEMTGYFMGQEVYYKGKPVEVVDMAHKGGVSKEGRVEIDPRNTRVLIRLQDGTELGNVKLSELSRPSYTEPYNPLIPQLGARELKPDLNSIWEDFKSVHSEAMNSSGLADVSDIKERYPDAWNKALAFDDPKEAMAAFADALSDMVASREVTPDIAESIGGRMQHFLVAREGVNFDNIVRAFTGARDLPFQPYYRYLANKLGEQLRQVGLSPEEYSLFNKTASKVAHEEISLNELAATNGYTLDPAPSGYFLRDAKTGTLLAFASDHSEVKEFVNGSGAATGPSLDGGGRSNAVPPGAVAGPAMPPSDPPPSGFNKVDDELHQPYEPSSGWLQKIADAYRLGMPSWVIKREALFTALDNKFGTRLWDRFFRPLQEAKMRMTNAAVPFHDELLKVYGEGGFTKEEWEQLGDAKQAFSPEEIIAGKAFGRPLTEQEINLGKLIGALNVDMPKVFKYLRVMTEAPMEERPAIDQAFNLTNEEKTAATTFNIIKGEDINKVALGIVTRLAHAIQFGEVSRQQYMADHSFSRKMRETVDHLDDITGRLGAAAGLDLNNMINGYLPHYRLNPDAPTAGQAFFFQKGWNASPEARFFSDMVRTGEIDAYERNPIIALMRYTNGLFKAREFTPVYKEAMSKAQAEWERLPAGLQQKAFSIISQYAGEMSGRPDAAVQFVQGVTDRTMEELHIDATPEVRKDFVNTVAALVYSSGIGFRPGITLRHVNQFMTLGGSRWPTMLPSAIGWAAKGLSDFEAVDNARKSGLISPLQASAFLTQEELDASGLGKAVDGLEGLSKKMANASMTVNGLKTVYELTQFGWGMAMREKALNALTDHAAGLLDEKGVARRLNLDTFQPSIQRAFLEQVRGGHFLEGANLIARQAAKETAFQYGLANHPMGWTTNAGRLFGIYGVWPTWMQDYSLSMLSRGSLPARMGWVARYATMQGALATAGKVFGLDMSYMYMGPGWFYEGLGKGAWHTFAPGLAETMGGPFFGLINSASQAVREPNDNLRALYRKRLLRDLTGLAVPGRGFFNDIYGATHDPRVQSVVQFWSRLVGIKPSDLRGILY